MKNALRSSKSEGRADLLPPGYEWHANDEIRNMMYYVYLIRSQVDANQVYTGFTENLRQRLLDHNAGKSVHTKKYLPWTLETYLAFSDRNQALEFERYLKTGSGIAFAKKRLRPSQTKSLKMENLER
ncbi:GIY-YIG nuclease family protein [Prosthecobacter sp. SYSU 5D2]